MPNIAELATPAATVATIDKTVSDLSTPNQKLQLLKLRITRDSNATTIEMQSDIDWVHHFVPPADAKNQSYYFAIGGVSIFKAKPFRMPDGPAIILNTGADDFYPDGRFNFNMLLTPKLQAGVKFRFPFPASLDHLKQWREEVRSVVKTAFIGFIKPIDLTLDMTIETGDGKRTT